MGTFKNGDHKLSDKPIRLLWPGAMMNKEMEMASEKLLNDNEIYVYPNPTSDILSVSVSSQKQSDHNVVAIFNTNGKCVYTATYDFFSGNNVLQVNVSDFIAGTYIISVREPNNNNKERRLKFVKK